jgi:hypothetical protein
MDYKIKKKKEEFEPVTVEITLNTLDELAWFTGCMNLTATKIHVMNIDYLNFCPIEKNGDLWEELDCLCRKYGLTKD